MIFRKVKKGRPRYQIGVGTEARVFLTRESGRAANRPITKGDQDRIKAGDIVRGGGDGLEGTLKVEGGRGPKDHL